MSRLYVMFACGLVLTCSAPASGQTCRCHRSVRPTRGCGHVGRRLVRPDIRSRTAVSPWTRSGRSSCLSCSVCPSEPRRGRDVGLAVSPRHANPENRVSAPASDTPRGARTWRSSCDIHPHRRDDRRYERPVRRSLPIGIMRSDPRAPNTAPNTTCTPMPQHVIAAHERRHMWQAWNVRTALEGAPRP